MGSGLQFAEISIKSLEKFVKLEEFIPKPVSTVKKRRKAGLALEEMKLNQIPVGLSAETPLSYLLSNVILEIFQIWMDATQIASLKMAGNSQKEL